MESKELDNILEAYKNSESRKKYDKLEYFSCFIDSIKFFRGDKNITKFSPLRMYQTLTDLGNGWRTCFLITKEQKELLETNIKKAIIGAEESYWKEILVGKEEPLGTRGYITFDSSGLFKRKIKKCWNNENFQIFYKYFVEWMRCIAMSDKEVIIFEKLINSPVITEDEKDILKLKVHESRLWKQYEQEKVV